MSIAQRYAPTDTWEGVRMDPDPEGGWVAASDYDTLLTEALMEANRAEGLVEDIECLTMCLDKAGVPRADASGATYSLWGRVMRLKPEQLNPQPGE